MKLLPYPEKPIFLCYHNKAFPFGIIQANAPEDITKWVCSKSVDCVFNPNTSSGQFDLYMPDPWGDIEGITTIQVINIKVDLIDLLNIDLLSLLKTMLENGYYIIGAYNEKFIPGKKAYNKYYYSHDFLLIGYDDNFFYSVGYVANDRFERYKIPISNFITSICTLDESIIQIKFIDYNKNHFLEPNVDSMISDLEQYILSTPPENPDKLHWGIAAIEKLRDFFVDEVVNHKRIYIDRRYTKVLYEHEWVLTKLIDIFLNNNEKEKFLIHSNVNLNRAHKIHLLGLKMGITGNVNLLGDVVKNINKIIEDEKQYIPKLVELLKNKHKNGLL